MPSREYDLHYDVDYLRVKKSVENSAYCLNESFFWDAVEKCKSLKEFKERAIEWLDMTEVQLEILRKSIVQIGDK